MLEATAIIILFLYFLPSLIAANRKHLNAMAIFVLNLFLGWTLLGWVGALVWACTAQQPRGIQARPVPARSSSGNTIVRGAKTIAVVLVGAVVLYVVVRMNATPVTTTAQTTATPITTTTQIEAH